MNQQAVYEVKWPSVSIYYTVWGWSRVPLLKKGDIFTPVFGEEDERLFKDVLVAILKDRDNGALVEAPKNPSFWIEIQGETMKTRQNCWASIVFEKDLNVDYHRTRVLKNCG